MKGSVCSYSYDIFIIISRFSHILCGFNNGISSVGKLKQFGLLTAFV